MVDVFDDWDLLKGLADNPSDELVNELAQRLRFSPNTTLPDDRPTTPQLWEAIQAGLRRKRGTASDDDVRDVLAFALLYIIDRAGDWYCRGMKAGGRSWWGFVQQNIGYFIDRTFRKEKQPEDPLVESFVKHYGGANGARIPRALLEAAVDQLHEIAKKLNCDLTEAPDRRSRIRRRASVEYIFNQTPDWPDAWRELDALLAQPPIAWEAPELVDFVRLRLALRIAACPRRCNPDRRNPDLYRLDRRWLREEVGRLVSQWLAKHPGDPPLKTTQMIGDVAAHADDASKDYSIHREDNGSFRLRLARPGKDEGSVRVTIVSVLAGAAPGENDEPAIVDEFELPRDKTNDVPDCPDREWWSVPSPQTRRHRVPAGRKLVMEVKWLRPSV